MLKIEGYWWPDDVGTKYLASLARVSSLKKVVSICKNQKRTYSVVQAGGSVGVWPKILSRHFNWVYTFEPDWVSFNCLSMNVQEHNVFKLQAALGSDSHGVSIDRKSLTSHKVSGPGPVPSMKIDDLNLEECDAILLDVEGYELKALSGASQTILTKRPLVLVEIRRGDKEKSELIKNLMSNIGYVQNSFIERDAIFVSAK